MKHEEGNLKSLKENLGKRKRTNNFWDLFEKWERSRFPGSNQDGPKHAPEVLRDGEGMRGWEESEKEREKYSVLCNVTLLSYLNYL